jgi:chromosomal replication initiator protein
METGSLSAASLPAASRPLQPADADALARTWAEVTRALQTRIRAEPYQTWFKRSALRRVDDDRVVFAVQNEFAKDWIRKNYTEPLADTMLEVFGSPRTVEIEVDAELIPTRDPQARAETAPLAATPQRRSGVQVIQSADVAPGALHSELVLNPKYTFDNFVVGPCNRFAHAAAAGAAEAPGKTYNPFFLHGPVGLGKTHLLQSMCSSILSRNPQARILYLSCESFVNHFIDALEKSDLQRFRDKYRNVDVLVVDDIHLLANKERTQEEFFHTFNTLYQAGKQIVLSSDSPPKDIPTLQDRLVSRFKWGLVVEIEPPCYETRMAILKRKSRDKGREFPDDVARLLAERIESNIRELEGAVTRVLAHASLIGAPISVETAREALREVFVARRGEPTMEEIIASVSQRYAIRPSELQGRRRTNAIAHARQVAMFLARRLTNQSLEDIGGYFGGRDHSTVLHAIDKIDGLAKSDPQCGDTVAELLAQLRQRTT